MRDVVSCSERISHPKQYLFLFPYKIFEFGFGLKFSFIGIGVIAAV